MKVMNHRIARLWLVATSLSTPVLSFVLSPFSPPTLPTLPTVQGAPRRDSHLSSTYGQDDQVIEAIESLTTYHEGSWSGKARSFTVVPDVAAGIVKRKASPEYQVSVKLGLNIKDRDFSLTETFSWDENKISSRSLSLNECNVDVDSVDASYSLDSSLPDFPSAISGTDKLCQFVIEHCIAASEERRMRCFLLYGVDQSLQRIVVCEETRIEQDQNSVPRKTEAENGNQLTARDLLEMQSDVDHLVDKITGNNKEDDKGETTRADSSESESSRLNRLEESLSSTDSEAQKLSLHDISLLELSSGVWLGDAIIRDIPTVKSSPMERGQGFGTSSREASKSKKIRSFGSWTIGVQKIAFRLMWNFGEEIRQVVDVGKAMGAELVACMSQSLSGTVCVNESLKRRMPKEDRMVYMDWTGDNMVGFLLGSAYIHAPRYLNFNEAATGKPFFTEFCLYQGTEKILKDKQPLSAEDEEENGLPELCCSKISRVYNFEGQLKQGCTSFYTFKRFGVDEMD